MATRPLATACPSGHPYTPDNTLHYDGYRRCRLCKSLSNQRYRLVQGQQSMPTIRVKQAEAAASNSQGRAMLHAPGVIGNRHGAGRPVSVPTTLAAVRSVVRSWAGRSLTLQPIGDLQRALAVLEASEAKLPEYSSSAPRLLGNLRTEIARRAA